MKTFTSLFISLLFTLAIASCTKTESDFSASEAETIAVTTSSTTVRVGSLVNFSATTSTGMSITSGSVFYINGTEITGSSHSFTIEGTYVVYAKKGGLTSPNLTITVVNTLEGYKHNILVEEYSGTWCGNCPRLLYGVDLLGQQTQSAVVVSIHLLGNDPFISTDGNNLAAYRNVSGVPTGHINRTVNWTGPQYENVQQPLNEIKASSNTGIAISSSLTGNSVAARIKYSFKDLPASATKLTVYLVEDGLKHTQRNYSANLYGGQANISNFNYDGVLRSIITPLQGDDAPNNQVVNEKNYTFSLPATISNVNNVKLVAFITDTAGNVLNAREAALNATKDFEIL